MPTNVFYVKKSRTDLYKRGFKPESAGKKVMTDHTKPADETDLIEVKKGEGYYWWKFVSNPYEKFISKEPPREWETIQSPFTRALRKIQLAKMSVSEIKTELSDLLKAMHTSLDAMPAHLQNCAPSAKMLHERICVIDGMLKTLLELEIPYTQAREEGKVFDNDSFELGFSNKAKKLAEELIIFSQK